MDMTPDRWNGTCAYLRDVFGAVRPGESVAGRIEATLAGWEGRARAAELPAIAISPDVGRFLGVLATLAGRAREATGRMIEVGTLGGYSAMWLARGMLAARPDDTRLITIEADARHAAFAAAEFERAGLGRVIEVKRGLGLEVLGKLSDELRHASVDLVFLDAEKTEYAGYAELAAPLLRPGGLLIADNALGSGNWWITDGPGEGPDERARASRGAIDRFNRAIAADARYEAACVPIREGVMVAVRG